MSEKCFCGQHSGHQANIKELCTFKKDTQGTISRMYDEIEKKVSGKVLTAFAIVLVSLTVGLFGLVYNSNMEMMEQMVEIKVNIQLLADKVK